MNHRFCLWSALSPQIHSPFCAQTWCTEPTYQRRLFSCCICASCLALSAPLLLPLMVLCLPLLPNSYVLFLAAFLLTLYLPLYTTWLIHREWSSLLFPASSPLSQQIEYCHIFVPRIDFGSLKFIRSGGLNLCVVWIEMAQHCRRKSTGRSPTHSRRHKRRFGRRTIHIWLQHVEHDPSTVCCWVDGLPNRRELSNTNHFGSVQISEVLLLSLVPRTIGRSFSKRDSRITATCKAGSFRRPKRSKRNYEKEGMCLCCLCLCASCDYMYLCAYAHYVSCPFVLRAWDFRLGGSAVTQFKLSDSKI